MLSALATVRDLPASLRCACDGRCTGCFIRHPLSAGLGSRCVYITVFVLCRDASFGQAFWLCAQAWKTLTKLPQAAVVMAALSTVDSHYQATAEALQSGLQAVCSSFKADSYVNVSIRKPVWRLCWCRLA